MNNGAVVYDNMRDVQLESSAGTEKVRCGGILPIETRHNYREIDMGIF
jgi:hypothetical protein